jgi:hypothetical protein
MINLKKITLDDTHYIDYIRSKLTRYPLECFDIYYKNKDILDEKWGVNIIAVLDNTQIVGFTWGDDGGLHFIYLEAGYRRKSLGTRLLILLEKSIKQESAFFKNKLKINGSNYPGDPGFVNFFHHYFVNSTDTLISKILKR